MGRIEGRVGKQTQGKQEECKKRGKWVFQVPSHTDGYMMEKKKTGEYRIKQQEEETN